MRMTHNLSFRYHADMTTKGLALGSAKFLQTLDSLILPLYLFQGTEMFNFAPYRNIHFSMPLLGRTCTRANRK